MSVNIRKLIEKGPKQLSRLKTHLLSERKYDDARIVQEYIEHCVSTSRMIKKIIKT